MILPIDYAPSIRVLLSVYCPSTHPDWSQTMQKRSRLRLAAAILGVSLLPTFLAPPAAANALDWGLQKQCKKGQQVVIVVTHRNAATDVYANLSHSIPGPNSYAMKLHMSGVGTDYWYTGYQYVAWWHYRWYTDGGGGTTSYGRCSSAW